MTTAGARHEVWEIPALAHREDQSWNIEELTSERMNAMNAPHRSAL